MIPPFGHCQTTRTDTIILLKENQSQIIFLNPQNKTVYQIKIDGCWITTGQRCDWVLITQNMTTYYIELKGNKLEKALSQLEATIRQLNQQFKQTKRLAFVVLSHCPTSSTEIQKLKIKFRENFQATLEIKSQRHTHSL